MQLSQIAESYKFWGVVSLRAKERLEHESIIALVLVTGIVRDGSCFQSRDPKFIQAGTSVHGS